MAFGAPEKIHYGWTLSGDWPRMAMVRALQQQAIANDPVVYDWPHIRARTLVIGGEKDGPSYPAGAKRVAETVQNGQVDIIPGIGPTTGAASPSRRTRPARGPGWNEATD